MGGIFTNLKIIKCWDRIINPKLPPPTIEIDITDKCNHACIMCTDTALRRGGEIGLDFIKEILNIKGLQSVVFKGGGDPTMHPHLSQLLEEANKRSISVGIETNGELLDDDLINVIIKCCDWIRLSIDATTEKVFKKTHGSKAFYEVIKNLKKLMFHKNKSGSKITVGVGYVIYPFESSVNDFVSSFDFFQPIDPDYVSYRLAEGVPKYNENLINILSKVISRNDLPKFAYLHNIQGPYFERKVTGSLTPVFNECIANRLVGVICANGDLAKCCFTKQTEHNYGNLHDDSFTSLWGVRNTDPNCANCVGNCAGRTTHGRYDDYNAVWEYYTNRGVFFA